MSRKISLLSIFLFCTTQALIATEIDKTSINPEAHSIQVGAFKNISNVYVAVDRLASYDVYVEAYKDMHRVHVVNIGDKKIVKKIRKFYPKAFFSKLNISADLEENIETEQVIVEPTTTYIQPVEISKEKVKVVEPQDWLLNSDSILKTRKSFL